MWPLFVDEPNEPRPLAQHSGYMASAYLSPAHLAEEARGALEEVEFDTLVGTGLSGSLVVPMLARELGKHWLIVRKEGDGSHSHLKAEGDLGAAWVFADDFIATGATLRRTHKAVARIAHSAAHATEFQGAYLQGAYPYGSPHFRTVHDLANLLK